MRSEEASLEFRLDNGPTQAFTTLQADRDQTKDENVFRELLQNCLDAVNPLAKCEVKISLETHAVADIPFIETYRKVFEYSKKYRSGKETETDKQVIARIERALNSDGKILCLFCADNGSGINHDDLRSLYGSGASTKLNAGRGSVGHGHLTAFAPSDLRYVLYSGRNKQDGDTFGGHAILATHKTVSSNGKPQLHSADGFVVEHRSDQQQTLFDDERGGRKIPPLLANRMLQEYGSVVMIAGYKAIRDVDPVGLILQSASQHFLVAIYLGNLALTVTDTNGTDHVLTKEFNDQLLADMSDKRTQNFVRRSWKTLTEGEQHSPADLGSGVSVWFRRHIDKSEGNKPRVSLFRDGMWIVDNLNNYLHPAKFSDHKPFDAVVNLDSEKSGSFGDLVRKAEGASHLQIRPGEITDSKDRKQLTRFLGHLKDFLREQADPRPEGEEYSPPELQLMGGAANPIRTKKRLTKQADDRGQKTDDAPSPAPGDNNNKGKGGRGGGLENNTQRVKPGNNAGIRASCRPTDKAGTQFHISWQIIDKPHSSGDLGLRLRLPSGTDRTSDTPLHPQYLKILRANSNGTLLDIASDEARIPASHNPDGKGTAEIKIEGVDDPQDIGLVEAEIVHRKPGESHHNEDSQP